MSRRIAVSSTMLFLMIALWLFTGSIAAHGPRAASPALTPPAQTIDCHDKMAVVKAIYNKFRTDANLKDQIGHINVSFKDGVVRLSGFATAPLGVSDKKAGIKRAVQLAKTATACEQSVVSTALGLSKGTCPPGKKECGDTCILEGEDCNLPPPPGE